MSQADYPLKIASRTPSLFERCNPFAARRARSNPPQNGNAVLALPDGALSETPQHRTFGSFSWQLRASLEELSRICQASDPKGALLKLRSSDDPSNVLSGLRVFGTIPDSKRGVFGESIAYLAKEFSDVVLSLREVFILDTLGSIILQKGSVPVRGLSISKDGKLFLSLEALSEKQELDSLLSQIAREFRSYREARSTAPQLTWTMSDKRLALLQHSRLFEASPKEAPEAVGKYRGRQIITPVEPILNGVFFPLLADHPIVVHTPCSLLDALALELERRISVEQTPLGVDPEYLLLQSLSKLVQQQLHNRSSKGVRLLHEMNRITKGEEVRLETYLRASLATPDVCALVAGAVLEILKSNQKLYLQSQISLHHCAVGRESHSWIRFHGSRCDYIVDPWNDYVGVSDDYSVERFPYSTVRDGEGEKMPRAF
ncbi:MAG: hypothetical protein KDD64_03755 [Bdellovibrionales bacterium]|nr:hypothetical protein [Bdellovibrionales bacterium]